jgi:hypothetical protein
MNCSTCGRTGHNSTTCFDEQPDFVPFDRYVTSTPSGDSYDCPICLEPRTTGANGIVSLECSHRYCPPCFASYMRGGGTNCAICRATIYNTPLSPPRRATIDNTPPTSTPPPRRATIYTTKSTPLRLGEWRELEWVVAMPGVSWYDSDDSDDE